MKLIIFVPCVPPKTTSQQKGAFVLGGKVKFYTKKEVAQAGNDMCSLLAPHRPRDPFTGPLICDVIMAYPFRKGESKKARGLGAIPIPTRPDADNINKMVSDVLTRAAFWTDDSLVADLRVRKVWSETTGIYLRIETINLLDWCANTLQDMQRISTAEKTVEEEKPRPPESVGAEDVWDLFKL